ncbi:MAG: hypothetical protein ACBR11_18405 [Microcoleus sp.]|uniref:hypothetical protein n=1 Tax=unclassified Microcoleus TaxID=2642155 RepID=UPI00312B3B04
MGNIKRLRSDCIWSGAWAETATHQYQESNAVTVYRAKNCELISPLEVLSRS